MTDARIEELRSEAKRQSLPGCGTFVNALELALKAIAYAESLTTQLSAIRDAGDEEVEGEFLVALQGDLLDDQREAIVKLHSIAISRGQQRDEVVGLLKKCHEVFREEMEQAKDCADWAESYRRILEIVEGK
jgi:hypothetical protein